MAILHASGHHPTAHVIVYAIVLATVLEKRVRAGGRENLSKSMCVGEKAIPLARDPALEKSNDQIRCCMERGRLLQYVGARVCRVLKTKVQVRTAV